MKEGDFQTKPTSQSAFKCGEINSNYQTVCVCVCLCVWGVKHPLTARQLKDKQNDIMFSSEE